MAIVRFDPLREFGSLQGEMNRLFNTFLDGEGSGQTRRWLPPMDLFETEHAFVARFDLPGMDEQAIDIEVEDRVLSVSGERTLEQEDTVDGWYRFERGHGQFRRTLQLPEGVDADAISASFDKGVLELRIPKPEQRKPRKVTIGKQAAIEGTASESAR